MIYPVQSAAWMRSLFPSCEWQVSTPDKVIYLSFDDGPHPVITPFVLDVLRRYQAKATFFCIGKNVAANPDLYAQILAEGHAVGNHTHQHVNGWRTSKSAYLADVQQAASFIQSPLFRPPYGKITPAQIRVLKETYRIIMWSVLSGDFDTRLHAEQVWTNVLRYTKSGSIVVMHDSEKAFPRLGAVLPLCLDYYSKAGYRFETLLN